MFAKRARTSWLPLILAAWLAIDLAFIFVGSEGLWWRL